MSRKNKIVNNLLDSLPQDKLIYGKILDLAFADGAFLIEIEKRKKLAGLTDEQIRKTTYGLENAPHRVIYVINRYGLKSTLLSYNFLELKNMHFDIIIGNPPYNNGEKTIYHLFVQHAIYMAPDILAMIIPSRWFSAGKGLDEFRDQMRYNRHIKKIVDYPDSHEVFSSVDIYGGVCYFIWEKEYHGLTEFVNNIGGIEQKSIRDLCEFDIIVRYSLQISILHKVLYKTHKFMDKKVSTRNPFGLPTTYRPTNSGDVKLYAFKCVGKMEQSDIPIMHCSFNKYKVFLPKAGDSKPIENSLICGTPIMAYPHEACTETYLVIDIYDSEEECSNLAYYINTKFFRFMLAIRKITQDAPRKAYKFVPDMDMNVRWTDEKLYDYFGLDQTEISFIEKCIRIR